VAARSSRCVGFRVGDHPVRVVLSSRVCAARLAVSRRSLCTRRLRRMGIGTSCESATITPPPSAATHRATPALFIDALGRPWALGWSRNPAVHRLRSLTPLFPSLTLILGDVYANRRRGWSPLCVVLNAVRDRSTGWYHTTVDQPLHLIYPPGCLSLRGLLSARAPRTDRPRT
jgi:hypothetical protein